MPLSNVPWILNGKEIRNITMNTTLIFGFTTSIVVYTYNGKVRFGLQSVNNLKMKVSKLLDNMLANLEDELAKVEKID